MKKLLALVLALVMTLSLCTVTNAAYPDAADVDYKEAVDVMSAVGVFKGDEKGNFNPDAILTRETAAKLIAYLDLGEKVAEALPAVKVFSDVEANRWSAKYVAYCADAGYIAGVGDGSFNPTGELTGYAFGKLLLCVLGYDANVEGFTGANWSIAVAKLMEKNGIAKSVDSAASAALSREAAAQYCLNTLKADCVEYDNKGTQISINGATIATGASAAKAVANTAFDYRTTGGDAVQQLCEKLYKEDLKLTDLGDDFGRPGKTWTYDKEEVFAAKEALATYAGADWKATCFTKDFKGYTGVAAADHPIYNGAAHTKTCADFYGKEGITVEVYGDKDTKTISKILVIEPYFTEVTKVTPAKKDTETSKITLKVYEAGYYLTHTNTWATIELDSEANEDAYNLVKDFAKGDVFMGTYAQGWEINKNLLAVDANVTEVTGKVSTLKADATYNGSVKVDGTTYTFANEYSQAAIAVKDEGTFYLYNGLVVNFAKEKAAEAQYALVLSNGSAGADKYGEGETKTYVSLLLTDGTVAKVEYKLDADYATDKGSAFANNDIVSYTVKNDVYTLSYAGVVASSTMTFTKGQTAEVDGFDTNSKTVFVVKTVDDDDEVTYAAYTGVKAMPTMKVTAAGAIDTEETPDGFANYVFCTYGEDVAASSNDLIFVNVASKSAKIVDADLGEYYEYDAVVEGKIKTIMVADGVTVSGDAVFKSGKLDKNGVYTDLTPATVSTDYKKGTNFTKAEGDVITVGSTKLSCTDDCVAFLVDADDDLAEFDLAESYSGATVLYTVNDDNFVTCIVVFVA